MSNGEHGWSVSTQVVISAQSIDAFFVCSCAVYVRDTATAKVIFFFLFCGDDRISKRMAFCCVRFRDGDFFDFFFLNPILPFIYFLFALLLSKQLRFALIKKHHG